MLKPGQVIDRYTVESALGATEWARVYRVRNNVLGGKYALKVLARGGAGLIQRLQREGRLQAALRHQGVVEVHDLIEVHGRPALVMDYVDGPDLPELLRRGPMAREVALAVFGEIAAAVGYAHGQGVVHGDLRPSNVLLERDGGEYRPKVGDFGLARALDEPQGEQETAADQVYIAPEQQKDRRRMDRRADVWSLGVLLWDLLGDRPAAPDAASLAEALAGSSLRERLPPAVLEALDGALQVDPGERFPDVLALIDALRGESAESRAEVTTDVPLHLCPACGNSSWLNPCPVCGEPSLLGDKYRLEVLVDTEGAFRTWRALGPDGTAVIAHGVVQAEAPRAWEALERSAGTLRSLEHPHIARYFDSFEQAGSFWLVRELIPGASLAEEVEQHRFTADEVIAVLEELLEVVVWLHTREPPLVHRDIRPSNLVRGAGGTLYLVGFTRVHAIQGEGQGGEYAAVGHLSYAAPEVFSDQIHPASDVYSVGAVGLALFSPKVFQGIEPAVDTSNLQVADAPLAELLRSMMRQDLDERPTAAEALEVLRGFRAGGTPTPRERSPIAAFGPEGAAPVRRRWVWIAALVLIAAALIGAQLLSGAHRAGGQPPAPQAEGSEAPAPPSRWPKAIPLGEIPQTEMQRAQLTTAHNLLHVFVQSAAATACFDTYGRELDFLGFERVPGGPVLLQPEPADSPLALCLLQAHQEVDYSFLQMPVPFQSKSPLPPAAP
ncbi:MAG: protein kinase [Deltaproteobacteria bacterium]|nr:protein kinase [Deltaproteobacteria bacterium]